ncbi:MAG: hypothetical protein JWP81_4394 [Ferruginibacter sp.]|nr:hypothetical protein [Ferruginibacter sp.]
MKSIIRVSIAIVFLATSFNCRNHSTSNTQDGNKKYAGIVAQTFKTGKGWGYEVFIDNKLFIKQSIIPVIEGNKAFARESDAIKVAELVVDKLKHRQKPIIRLDELQQLELVTK